MNNRIRPPLEVRVAAISWAQLLTSAASIKSENIRDLSGAIDELVKHHFPIYDWTKFGGLAIGLNIIACVLLAFPTLVWSSSRKRKPGGDAADRKYAEHLGTSGIAVWALSFIIYTGYLNAWFAIASTSTMLLGLTYMAWRCRNIAPQIRKENLGHKTPRRKAQAGAVALLAVTAACIIILATKLTNWLYGLMAAGFYLSLVITCHGVSHWGKGRIGKGAIAFRTGGVVLSLSILMAGILTASILNTKNNQEDKEYLTLGRNLVLIIGSTFGASMMTRGIQYLADEDLALQAQGTSLRTIGNDRAT